MTEKITSSLFKFTSNEDSCANDQRVNDSASPTTTRPGNFDLNLYEIINLLKEVRIFL